MRAQQTRLCVLAAGFDNLDSVRRFRTAVSLHCHTQHSREILDFIPQYASRIPVVSKLFGCEVDRYYTAHGQHLDFASAYWTPPVSARTVFELELRQIERRLGLQGLVSITDHDEIKACSLLQVLDLSPPIPISLEWTVPFGGLGAAWVAGFPENFSGAGHRLQSRDLRSQLFTQLVSDVRSDGAAARLVADGR